MSSLDAYTYVGLFVLVGFALWMVVVQKAIKADETVKYFVLGCAWLVFGVIWFARLYSKGMPHPYIAIAGASALFVGDALCFRAAHRAATPS